MKDKHGVDGTDAGVGFGQSSDREDMVGRLVSLLRPGREIPAEGGELVKAALRPEWQRLVAARTPEQGALGGRSCGGRAVILGVAPADQYWQGDPNHVGTGRPTARLGLRERGDSPAGRNGVERRGG